MTLRVTKTFIIWPLANVDEKGKGVDEYGHLVEGEQEDGHQATEKGHQTTKVILMMLISCGHLVFW